jgi:hypothetical protein
MSYRTLAAALTLQAAEVTPERLAIWADMLDAERKAGLRLKELDRAPQGGRPKLVQGEPVSSEYRQAVASAELNLNQAKRWQLLAALPEPEYQAFKAEVREDARRAAPSGRPVPAADVPHRRGCTLAPRHTGECRTVRSGSEDGEPRG